MKIVNKKLLLTLLLAVSFALSLQSLIISAPPQVPPTINYGGSVYNGDGSYTFTYYVTSNCPVIKKWQLYSPCFKHNGPTVTAEAEDSTYGAFTPDWYMNKTQHYIEFKHESKQKFTDGLTRTYKVTIWAGTYSGMIEGDVDYTLHWPSCTEVEGTIEGPLCVPGFEVDESPLGTLGTLIPLGAAFALIGLYNKRTLFTTRF
ncbi:unnamed protein product [marine sediment metagenome]|uniref:Uncharacterized protein n=1 Tax=marine sediment metagenome TaxID=412755 RepID=X0X6D4_9ZZZZ